MICRFRGAFNHSERTRIEQAVHRFERACGDGEDNEDTAWAFIHFTTSYQGAPYWGVRADESFVVKAQTGKGLAMAVDITREEEIKRRSRALRHASQSVSRALEP